MAYKRKTVRSSLFSIDKWWNILSAAASVVIIIYTTSQFITKIDYRIDALERGNDELRLDLKEVISQQSTAIAEYKKQLVSFEVNTNARLKILEERQNYIYACNQQERRANE